MIPDGFLRDERSDVRLGLLCLSEPSLNTSVGAA
jgi:hypothetical protein